MNQEQIDFLKKNLSIYTKEVSSHYGSTPYVMIILQLGDEVISECYIELPQCNHD